MKNNTDNFNHKLEYLYNQPTAPTLSSGVLPFEPGYLSSCIINDGTMLNSTKTKYKKEVYKYLDKQLFIARQLPPVDVMYQFVTIKSSVINPDNDKFDVEGKTIYEFEVFRKNMVDRIDLGVRPTYSYNGETYDVYSNQSIKNFTASLGNLRRITIYDNLDKKLSETTNHYLHDGLESKTISDLSDAYDLRLASYNYQGSIKERFSTQKRVAGHSDLLQGLDKATMLAREEYPNIKTGTTVVDYKAGTKTKNEILAFDFYSGAVTETVEIDVYGNRLLTKVIPAYRKYTSLGLKINNNANKNMLTQEAGVYVYKVNSTNTKLGLVSAISHTWSNSVNVIDEPGNLIVQNGSSNGDVWRKLASYSWMPDNKTADGLTTMGFPDFNWATPGSSDVSWKKLTESTLFDVYSKVLETKDMNNNFSATRTDYGSKRVILSGTSGNYYEIAYSGAEDDGVNQSNNIFIKKVNGVLVSGPAVAHTGLNSLQVPGSGQKAFVYTVSTNNLVTGRDYKASVWVKSVNGSNTDVKLYYDINGVVKANSISSGSSIKYSGEWYLLDLVISGTDIVPGATLNVGCRNDHSSVQAYVDDMRFQPVNSATSAYVYDKKSGELTHTLDNNNLYTRYEYDGMGRLTKIHREKLGMNNAFKTNEYLYNFSATKYNSNLLNSPFTRNNCPAGYIGTPYQVNFPDGAFVSYISIAEANQMRDRAAQKVANENGGCAIPAYMPVSVPTTGNRIFTVNFIQNGIYVRSQSFFESGGTVNNIPAGTYTVNVTQTNNTSRQVNLTGFSPQTGVSVDFNNVTLNGGVFSGTLTIN